MSVMIIGVGMTRFGKQIERSVRDLASDAVALALRDAGVPPEEVDIVFFGNAMSGLVTGQESIRGQVALKNTGLLGKPIFNVDNACASSSSAAHLAAMAIASGTAEVAVVVGAEKLTHEDKAVTFRAFASTIDLETMREEALGLHQGFNAATIAESLSSGGTRSNFMDGYASMARQYMERTGATREDLARIVVKSRRFGSMNEHAQFRVPTTVDEVLTGREVSDPLTLPMCSPIGDGAAALVLCSAEFAERHQADGVSIAASVVQSGSAEPPRASERASARAYELAGVAPGELDVVELHDAAAPAEMIYYEELGLCGEGDGPRLVRDGDTDLGGRVPVNTSGGLLSRGHPVGATGCAQLVELTTQLRGRAGKRQVDGARIGLAHNGGGSIVGDVAASVVTILVRP